MKWHIRVVGKLPEQLELEADSLDEAENQALNEVFDGIELIVEPIDETPRLFLVQRRQEGEECQPQSKTKISI